VCGGLNYNLPYRDVNLLLFYYNELTILCSLFIAFSVQCYHNNIYGNAALDIEPIWTIHSYPDCGICYNKIMLERIQYHSYFIIIGIVLFGQKIYVAV